MPTGSFRACFIIDEQANRSGSEDFKYDEGDISDPEDNRGPPRCKKACFGDPIDATTGNKFETHTEFVSGGPFPLRIEWTYNANGTSAALLPKDLMFGRNRSHFYGRRVTSTTAGNLTQTLVARPDGKTLRFYKAEDAGWASDGDDPGRLSLEALPGGASLYRFDDGKGGVEFYDMNGQLLRLRDADGEEQTLAYAAGMLDRVVDRYGRALTFEYDGGHLVRLHQPDGQVITFAYSSNGGHYKALIEGQNALKNQLARVVTHCQPLPPEYNRWTQLAWQIFPRRH